MSSHVCVRVRWSEFLKDGMHAMGMGMGVMSHQGFTVRMPWMSVMSHQPAGLRPAVMAC